MNQTQIPERYDSNASSEARESSNHCDSLPIGVVRPNVHVAGDCQNAYSKRGD
ncbi:hypothetical protein [Novipirellula rosea]|uniref:hypothetical protein n=1 Tax=Novipirellula rosea TaxID=1031540 RepID=UPI0030EEFB4D